MKMCHMTLVSPYGTGGGGNLLSGKRFGHDGQPDKVFPRFNQSHVSSVKRRHHKGPSEALPADSSQPSLVSAAALVQRWNDCGGDDR